MYSKSVITGQLEIYKPNGAEVTLSKFLRLPCFYICLFPQALKNGVLNQRIMVNPTQ